MLPTKITVSDEVRRVTNYERPKQFGQYSEQLALPLPTKCSSLNTFILCLKALLSSQPEIRHVNIVFYFIFQRFLGKLGTLFNFESVKLI